MQVTDQMAASSLTYHHHHDQSVVPSPNYGSAAWIMFLCSSLSRAQSSERFHICYTCVYSIWSANGKDQTNHHFCQKNKKKKINNHRQSTKVKGSILCRVDINSKPLEKCTYQLDEASQMLHFIEQSGAFVCFQQAVHEQDNADRFIHRI